MYRLDIELLEEGCHLATSEDVQGLVAQAKSVSDAIKIAKDVTCKILNVQNVEFEIH